MWNEDAKTFLLVVELGSFTAAAVRLTLPVSSVSRRVARLEERLGIQLLQRTTRSLRLTHAGEIYAQEMRELFEREKELEAKLSGMATEPHGTLRVTGTSHLSNLAGPMFQRFLERYPKVGLQLFEEDRVADLIGEGIDAALRGASIPEPGLIYERLLSLSFRLYARPSYLSQSPPILELADLANSLCILSGSARTETWSMTRSGLTESVKVRGRFGSPNLNARYNAALWGMGVALLPDLMCERSVKEGHLTPVLPDYETDPGALWLVYAEARYRSSALRAFISYVKEFPWRQDLLVQACDGSCVPS